MSGETSGQAAGGVSHRRTSPDDIIDEWANAPEDADLGGEEGRPEPRPGVIAEMKGDVPYLCPPKCGKQHDHKRFDSLRALVQYGLMTISNAWVDAPYIRGQHWPIPDAVAAKSRAGHELLASEEDILDQETTMVVQEYDRLWEANPHYVPDGYEPGPPVRVLPYESYAFVSFWGRAKVKAELDLLVYLSPGLSASVDEARREHVPIARIPEVEALLNQWRQNGPREEDDLPASLVRHAHRVLVEDVDGALNRILRLGKQAWKHPKRREETIRKYGYDNVADLLIPDDASAVPGDPTLPGRDPWDPDAYRSCLTGLTLEELLGSPLRIWGDMAETYADPDIPMNEWSLSTRPRRKPKPLSLAYELRALADELWTTGYDDGGMSGTSDDDWDF